MEICVDTAFMILCVEVIPMDPSKEIVKIIEWHQAIYFWFYQKWYVWPDCHSLTFHTDISWCIMPKYTWPWKCVAESRIHSCLCKFLAVQRNYCWHYRLEVHWMTETFLVNSTGTSRQMSRATMFAFVHTFEQQHQEDNFCWKESEQLFEKHHALLHINRVE